MNISNEDEIREMMGLPPSVRLDRTANIACYLECALAKLELVDGNVIVRESLFYKGLLKQYSKGSLKELKRINKR